jgi:UDP-N-acetylmuramoyl-tripeptide--D-alanyl-D-alanine ligase
MPQVLSSDFIQNALHLPLSTPSRNFEEVQTDSRKKLQNSLFIAIPGEFFDGHDFMSQAIENGATGILCQANHPKSLELLKKSPSEILIFPVEDPVSAFRCLSKAWRDLFSLPMIAIAGSVGKTTTKEFLASLFRGKWENHVLQTEQSQNGYLGVAMTLMRLRGHHQVGVIEIGIDEPDAMEKHLEIVQPTSALLTAIGPEHLDRLRDLETVIYEEGLCLRRTAELGGKIAVNLDDPAVFGLLSFPELRDAKEKALFSLSPASSLSFLKEKKMDFSIFVQGETISPSSLKIKVTAARSEAHSFEFEIFAPLPGKHNHLNLLGAVTTALQNGLSAHEIEKGIVVFRGAEGRSHLASLSENTQVLCDYYNSNPTSVQAALSLLRDLQNESRAKANPPHTFLCLGDMLELGSQAKEFHRNLALSLKNFSCHQILLYGNLMKELFDELRKDNEFLKKAYHFDDRRTLSQHLLQELSSEQNLILVKGSRSMKMEEVWQFLQDHGKTAP